MCFLLLLLAVIFVCFSALLLCMCRIFGSDSLGGAHPLSDPPQTSLEHDQ